MPFRTADTQLLIEGIRSKLATVIQPELQSADAHMAATMIQGLLGHLQFMQAELDTSLARHDQANRELLEKTFGAAALQAAPEAEVAASMAQVFSHADIARKAMASGVIANFEDFHDRREAFEDRVATRLAELSKEQPDIAQLFHDYLSQRFGQSFGQFENCRRIPGGFSKETYIIQLHADDYVLDENKIVLRIDSPGLPTGASVMDEFPLLALFNESSVPISKPLWCEPDAKHIGEPFQVSACVEGIASSSSDETVAMWGDDPKIRRQLGEQAARILAKLHSIQPDGGPYNLVAIVRDNLVRSQAFDKAYRSGTEPVIDLMYGWLHENIPKSGGSVSWLHGDFGPYNMLVKDGEVQAVLDWELVHLGDPMEDLAYCRPFFQSVLPWQDFMAIYHEHGGCDYDPSRAKFYEVLRSVGILGKIAKFRFLFDKGINKEIKMLFPSLHHDLHFIRAALEVIKPELSAIGASGEV